ncbi:MAG: thioredoxin family protein [Deltaproteobacteria bacterium]|nr:thioredoxin family protein [Deltaproteobacteria bacterium]
MRSSTDRLRPGILRALNALGFPADAVAHDGSLFPKALAHALEGDSPVLVRAGVALAPASTDLGPVPRDPIWLRVEPEGSEVRAAALLGHDVRSLVATRVEVEAIDEWCCDAPKCERTRKRFEVRLLAGSSPEEARLTLLEGTSRTDAERLAAALQRRLGIDLGRLGPEAAADEVPASPPTRDEDEPALPAVDLSQLSLRCEAGRWVLRDRVTLGPRASLGRELLLFGVVVAATLGAGIGASVAWHAGDRERAAIFGICGVVGAIAAFAVSQIALHSARYRAEGAPVLFACRDRFVAAPWVARDGAVMLLPEGRYGAGLPIGGIDRIAHVAEDGAHRLVCVSDHGSIELASFGSERAALAWQRVVLRMLEMARHVGVLALTVASWMSLAACGADGGHAVTSTPSSPGNAKGSWVPAAPGTARSAAAPMPLGTASAQSVSPSATTPTAVAADATSTPPARPAHVQVPTIDDDLPRALAEGRARNVPVFVDVWAAWCHTCLSMRSYVLPDPAIAGFATEVVFATLDSENERNVEVLERYRVGVWPTFFVLAPRDGEVLGLWEGSASVEELRTFLRGTLDVTRASSEPALAALLQGSRAQAAGNCTDALRYHRKALSSGGKDWSRRGEAVKGLIYCQRRLRKWKDCIATGIAEVPGLVGASTPADVAGTLLDCADAVDDARLRREATDVALARLERLVADPPVGASTDDRSDALGLLAGALRARGRRDEATRLVERQLAMLENAAASAVTPEAAATFDYARMNAYLVLGRQADAVTMLERRAAELPDAYEPRARLAQALSVLGRHEEALTAVESALARVKGPRRTRYLTMLADVLGELGRTDEERRVLGELVRAYESLPPGLRKNPSNVAGLTTARARLAALR